MGDAGAIVTGQDYTHHTKCLTQAVTSTFASICGFQPEPKQETSNGSLMEGIVGIISLIGAEYAFSLMLGLPHGTAESIARKFAGFHIPFEDPDMADVVGELANIVAGDAAARLDALGVKAELSLPTVARGSNLEMLLPEKLSRSRIDFSSAQGDFWLKLAFGKHNTSFKR